MISPKQFSLYSVRAPLQDDSRGFLLLMGSEEPLCVFVCVRVFVLHTNVTATVSPAHQRGYTSCLRSARAHDVTVSGMRNADWERETRSDWHLLSSWWEKEESVIICHLSLFSWKAEKDFGSKCEWWVWLLIWLKAVRDCQLSRKKK